MRKFYKKKKRGPVQSKKIVYDNITFASGLERYMYMALKKAKIRALYEGETFELFEGFDFPFESYERCGNGKGDYKNRGNKKILNIKYTPDFVGRGFIIETKGRANESFPLRWKMFKKLVAENKIEPFVLYKPQNQKECDETIRLILKKQS
tara:strand:+ start:3148 stop:3600 length:453 start_codon:yes stop_codon:yes gene_type:complete